jgi:mono/diheme cytochrome c family protein
MTNTMKTIMIVLSAAGVIALGPGLETKAGPAGARTLSNRAMQNPDSDRGRDTYFEYGCVACHGGEGQGAGNTGPRLGPNPTPFARFSTYIRQPSGNMPPYTAEVVTEQELADIYAFLESLPTPPSADSVLPED